ncbi:MAG: hypothetical protein DRN01_06400 [Thermoplasmata archaeon]|nr:MAG: hypothetical protein DRN01_06400 [Thermoplasmata archaeon]
MARISFACDTITKDGLQHRGSIASVDDAYAKDLVRLAGVEYVEAEAPKKPTKAKKPKKPKKEVEEDDI